MAMTKWINEHHMLHEAGSGAHQQLLYSTQGNKMQAVVHEENILFLAKFEHKN